jgi:hypothetical protein
LPQGIRRSWRSQLLGILATGGPLLSGGRIEASKKCPGIPRPSGVEQRVVPETELTGQFRIAQFDLGQTEAWADLEAR